MQDGALGLKPKAPIPKLPSMAAPPPRTACVVEVCMVKRSEAGQGIPRGSPGVSQDPQDAQRILGGPQGVPGRPRGVPESLLGSQGLGGSPWVRFLCAWGCFCHSQNL